MFIGFVKLGETLSAGLLITDGDGQPVDADGDVTFRAYNASGHIASGTLSALDAGATDGFYLIDIDALGASGYQAGDLITLLVSYEVAATPQAQAVYFMVT